MVCCLYGVVMPLYCPLNRGADFRQAFRRIGGLRALVKVPFMSLTASAPANVEADIVSCLGLTNVVYIRQSLNRPNTYFSVRTKSSLAVSKECIVFLLLCLYCAMNREIFLVFWER